MTDTVYIYEKQFLINSYYDDYIELKSFMDRDPAADYSWATTAFNSLQLPIWRDPVLAKQTNHRYYDDSEIINSSEFISTLEKITAWTQEKLNQYGLNYNIRPAVSWAVDYKNDGWQGVHTHGKKVITQVIYTEVTKDNDPVGKEILHGAFYAFMVDNNSSYMKTVLPSTGTCIIAKGDVFHGVYPVKSIPRNCLIIDYVIL